MKTGLSVLLQRTTEHGPIRITIGNAFLGFLSHTEVRHRIANLSHDQIDAIMTDLSAAGGEHRLNSEDGPIDRIVDYWRGHPTPEDV